MQIPQSIVWCSHDQSYRRRTHQFAVELDAGDLLLLCSRRLEVPEDELVTVARTAVDDATPLDELARTIEHRVATALDDLKSNRAQDVAFAIAVARPRSHDGPPHSSRP